MFTPPAAETADPKLDNDTVYHFLKYWSAMWFKIMELLVSISYAAWENTPTATSQPKAEHRESTAGEPAHLQQFQSIPLSFELCSTNVLRNREIAVVQEQNRQAAVRLHVSWLR